MTILCADLTNSVTVDDDDYERLAQWQGRLRFNAVTGAYFCEGRKIVYLHREIMSRAADIEGKQVCFVNRNRLDCRKDNLFVYDPLNDPADFKRRMRKKRLRASR